jgi:hypothetical protein
MPLAVSPASESATAVFQKRGRTIDNFTACKPTSTASAVVSTRVGFAASLQNASRIEEGLYASELFGPQGRVIGFSTRY